MKKDDDALWRETVAGIENELHNIDKLRSELAEVAMPASEMAERRQAGSILHDFYNCCERVFRRIASELNGGFGSGSAWHKELLYRMTIPVRDVRPQVVSEELAAELDDYLSFRHVFRNLYGFELKGERLIRLVEKFERVSVEFEKQIQCFLKEMERE